ncbi:MAG: hypothetical protein K6E59_00420 [Bacilli bacterium]|nr:hypothetical protein [Bacilli bacterium]
MAKNQRIRTIVAIFINALIVGLAGYCLVSLTRSAINGNNRFIYFTNISNVTVGFLAIANLVLLILSVVKDKNVVPPFFSWIKFVGISMTTLTFFTVLFVIGPIDGYAKNFSGRNFLTHLIIPLSALFSCLFLEEKLPQKWRYSLFVLIPFGIYAVFYVLNVVMLASWPDIYRINQQGLWYLFLLAFIIADFGIGQGMYFLKAFLDKKLLKEKA